MDKNKNTVSISTSSNNFFIKKYFKTQADNIWHRVFKEYVEFEFIFDVARLWVVVWLVLSFVRLKSFNQCFALSKFRKLP